MKQKDLKIDFRYLTGNIACLSVDSISGESVHNDINNEEAIIIFNSLVGEKVDCQTVKSLLKENQELKKQLEEYKNPIKYFKYANKNVTEENKQLKDKLSKIETLIINHNCDTGDIYYKYNNRFLKSELKQRILEIVYEERDDNE